MTSVLGGRRELWASLLIGLCCLLVYNANGRAISAGDTYPARYLPFAIWQHHSLRLDPIATLTAQGQGAAAYWMMPAPGGHVISLYPVVVPVLLAPLYLPAVGYLRLRGWTDGRLDHVARVMEKLAASLVAALSAALFYVLLRRRAAAPIALLLTLAYAFGTTTWMIGSQALWQHGMAELLVIGLLLLLTGPCTVPRALAAGLLCGLIAANRPPDAILAAALGAYGLVWAGRRRVGLLAAGAALPVGLVLLYNLGVADNLAGGYGRGAHAHPGFLSHDLLSGLGGLLFSPTRGLFVFSPFLLFLVLAWRHLPRDRDERALTLAMSAGVLLQVLLYAKTDWRAGTSWGPRYMTDLLPLLLWMLVPAVAALRGLGRAGFLLAVGAAVVIETIGAFWYTGATESAIFAVASGPQQMRAAWDWRNAPFVASLQQGLAPAELMTEMRGNLDSIEAGRRATSAVTAGQEIVATGWALAGHATPWQVAVNVDGGPPVASHTFFDRSDVRGALREASPAGWRIPLATAGLAPGEHHLTAFAWASEKGEGYYLEERKLTVRRAPAADTDLDAAFRTAAERIRAHQQGPGYWLTAYTSAARFEAPRPEMNTFLTALLVDLLDPLAGTGSLGDSLQRARRHLTGQIEAGGLVRYHGLPGRSRHRHPGVRDHPGYRRHGAGLEARSRPRPPAAAGRAGDPRPISHPRGALPHLARTARGLSMPRSGERSGPCRPHHPDAPAAAARRGGAAGRPCALRGAPPGGRPGPGLGLLSDGAAGPDPAPDRPPARRLRAGAARVADADAGAGPGDLGVRRPAPGTRPVSRKLTGRRGRRGRDPGGAAPTLQGRLRSVAKESAAPLPQRSHRDGPSILLVGGRWLRALAKACSR